MSCTDQYRYWNRATLILIGAWLLFRLIYAAIVPLDLAPDEAYYWDWSRHLDWGYYSKPPMVAWLIFLSTSLGGASTFFVRLPAVLLSTVCGWFLYLLGRRMFSSKVGFWSVCLAAAAPGNAVLSLLMTIDAPLLFFWCLALYTFWRFIEAEQYNIRWMTISAAVVGLGLLSKQTMLVFFLLAGIFLITEQDDRRQLTRWPFWLWIAASMLFLLPVIFWNSRHNWVTFYHTLWHFETEAVGFKQRIIWFGEFFGSQFGVLSPVTFGLFMVMAGLALRSIKKLERRERFLFCFSVLPLLAVLALAFRQRVQPNWPAAIYPAGIVFLVAWILGCTVSLRAPMDGIRVLRRTLFVSAIFIALTYLIPLEWSFRGTALDLAARLREWHSLGKEIGITFKQIPNPDKTFLFAATSKIAASELAFYLPGQPQVYLFNPNREAASQYDLWPGPWRKIGWNALIVTDSMEPPPLAIKERFRRIEFLRPVSVPIGNDRAHAFALWHGIELF